MNVLFKNAPCAYNCTEPIEQKLFKSGVSAGWVIMFHIVADITSSDIDEVITPEGMAEMVFTNDGGDTTTITGYSKATACTIRHKNDATTVEVQFTKTNEPGVESE